MDDPRRQKMLATLEKARAKRKENEEKRKAQGLPVRISKKMRAQINQELERQTETKSVKLEGEEKKVVDQFVTQENQKLERLKEQGASNEDLKRFFGRQEQLLGQLVTEISDIKRLKLQKRGQPKVVNQKPPPPSPKEEEKPKQPKQPEQVQESMRSSFLDRYA